MGLQKSFRNFWTIGYELHVLLRAPPILILVNHGFERICRMCICLPIGGKLNATRLGRERKGSRRRFVDIPFPASKLND
jgi:hypothetical protein